MGNPSQQARVEQLHARITAQGVVPLVIAGPYRSGTSLVASICQALGAYIGEVTTTGGKHNPLGTYEAPELARLCRQMYAEPWLNELLDRPQRVTLLSSWLSTAMTEAPSTKLIGGKHPILCMLVDEVLEAWGDRTRFIFVRRPIEEALQSLKKTSWPDWRDSPGAHEHATNLLAQARDRGVDRLGERCLVVEYHELLKNPAAEVERIARYLGTLDHSVLANAIGRVRPELYRSKSGGAS